jgi:DNA-binding MarR family transcriptional regulator
MPWTTVAEADAARHKGVVNAMTLARNEVPGTRPTEQAASIENLMGLMREVGDLMTPQALQIIMRVYAEPGLTMQTLEKRTGLSLASVSRNLMALGEWHRLGRPGLGLVECVDDPNERRRKIAFLTPKGRKFVSKVLSIGRPVDEVIEVNSPTASEYLNQTYKRR